MIYYAPVLPAEKWTSIDVYCANYEKAMKSYLPKVETENLLVNKDVNLGKWSKRVHRDILYGRKIRKNFKKNEGVLHVFDHAYAHLCKYGEPSIVHCHDLNHFVKPSLKGLHLERWKQRVMAMKKATRVIAISEQLSSEIQKHVGISEDKISIVYNGLDHGLFKPALEDEAHREFPQIADLKKEAFLILNVGTNLDRKNLDTVYQSLVLLKAKGVNAKLIRVGTNDSRAGEQERIEALGLEKDVIQMGIISGDQVALLYNLCHVLSFASLYEGFGWPLVEAQACGLPVVAADNSCIPEIAGDGALYHKPMSAEDLVSSLMKVYSDAEVTESLRERGYKNAQRFSWEKHVRELVRVYQTLA